MPIVKNTLHHRDNQCSKMRHRINSFSPITSISYSEWRIHLSPSLGFGCLPSQKNALFRWLWRHSPKHTAKCWNEPLPVPETFYRVPAGTADDRNAMVRKVDQIIGKNKPRETVHPHRQVHLNVLWNTRRLSMALFALQGQNDAAFDTIAIAFVSSPLRCKGASCTGSNIGPNYFLTFELLCFVTQDSFSMFCLRSFRSSPSSPACFPDVRIRRIILTC